MPATTASLPTRDDTLFGVCEGLGEEFGFHPNYLRVLLGALLLWSPLAVIGLYLAAGTVLAIGRWLVPARRTAVDALRDDAAGPPVAENDAVALSRAA